MLTTPYDVMNQPLIHRQKPKKEQHKFQYGNKFRSALYAFLLFLILSHKVSYKILDIIIGVFSSEIDIIDDDENPTFIGTLIMAIIIAIVIFLF